MHVRMRRMCPPQHRRLFLESRDLRVQRYSGKVEIKQSLHFEKDCFEYKEYTANIVDAYIHSRACKCVRYDNVGACNFFL